MWKIKISITRQIRQTDVYTTQCMEIAGEKWRRDRQRKLQGTKSHTHTHIHWISVTFCIPFGIPPVLGGVGGRMAGYA